jgi:hypothetical protein
MQGVEQVGYYIILFKQIKQTVYEKESKEEEEDNKQHRKR